MPKCFTNLCENFSVIIKLFYFLAKFVKYTSENDFFSLIHFNDVRSSVDSALSIINTIHVIANCRIAHSHLTLNTRVP